MNCFLFFFIEKTKEEHELFNPQFMRVTDHVICDPFKCGSF